MVSCEGVYLFSLWKHCDLPGTYRICSKVTSYCRPVVRSLTESWTSNNLSYNWFHSKAFQIPHHNDVLCRKWSSSVSNWWCPGYLVCTPSTRGKNVLPISLKWVNNFQNVFFHGSVESFFVPYLLLEEYQIW